MTWLPALSALSLVGRLALVILAGRELLTACTLPRGRLRRRHAAIGVTVLIGSVIRL